MLLESGTGGLGRFLEMPSVQKSGLIKLGDRTWGLEELLPGYSEELGGGKDRGNFQRDFHLQKSTPHIKEALLLSS